MQTVIDNSRYVLDLETIRMQRLTSFFRDVFVFWHIRGYSLIIALFI